MRCWIWCCANSRNNTHQMWEGACSRWQCVIHQWLADQVLDGVQLYYEKFTQSNICPLSTSEGVGAACNHPREKQVEGNVNGG